MAYTTGSAADMAAVKTALVNACTADGWTEQTDAGGKTVLDKNGIYVRVEATTDGKSNPAFDLLGRTGLDSGDAPAVVSMRTVGGAAGTSEEPVSFPVTYHAFTFTNEVFMVINYSNKYQWCAFGQSQQNGLSGTGNWVSASVGSITADEGIEIGTSNGGGAPADTQAGTAMFWNTRYYNAAARGGWIHNDIEASYPWALDLGTNGGAPVGIKYLTELLETQPNNYNLESILMPIRAYKRRPEDKISQILEVANARHIRIDHYQDEQVITLGTDDWMIFPYYKRDKENRDGGVDIMHTGTFGWAIKKA